jgi:hypothetical protein
MAQFGDFTVDRNSTKYVLGSGGNIISYATDEPAFEFNADGSYKGLLVEPAATNLISRSEDITTGWSFSDATRTADATTAPDGNTTADELTATGSGPRIYQGFSASTVKYTASVFLKGNGLDFARITMLNGSGYQFYGLSGSGTVGGSGGGTVDDATIEAYPNGWYRCTLTWTQATATTVTFLINGTQSISDATVNPTGSPSIYIWGAQVETGPIATSYIPTTTASVTRVKDDITLGSASSLIGQTEGTLYLEVYWRLATGTEQHLLSANNGTANNRLLIYNSNSPVELRMVAVANNSFQTIQGVSSTGFSGIQKFAFAYKTDDFELYRNGSSISSDTSGSLAALTTLTDIDIGQRATATLQANMHIRAVALYPTRLSDAECQALTTL